MAQLKKRLERLENGGGKFGDVMDLIRKGKYYDDLTEAQKVRYCLYRYGTDHNPDEYLDKHFGHLFPDSPRFDPHFQLERKPRPMTPAELEQEAQEVQNIVQEITDKYNSPEETAKRRARYEELQRIGKLREAAYKAGRSMDEHPLPWEK